MLPWHCGGGAAGTGALWLLKDLGFVLSITHTIPMPLAVHQSCGSVTVKSQSQTEGFGLQRLSKDYLVLTPNRAGGFLVGDAETPAKKKIHLVVFLRITCRNIRRSGLCQP